MNDAALMYDARKKSLLIAYLLWWFLGMLGVHRFYLGHTSSGVIMLLLFVVSFVLTIIAVGLLGFVVLGLWWLIDAFLLPSMVTSHNVALVESLR